MAPGGAAQQRLGQARLLAAVAAAVAAAAYLNTIPAQFTFDDSFAVLYNGDVTDHNKTLRALLHNDFWGQELRSPMSHKSYRPLTVLSFRLQHLISIKLLPGGKPQPTHSEWEEEGEGRRSGDRGLNPLPFHICNVLAHAGVTALVFELARQLAAARKRRPGSGSIAGSAGSGGNGTALNGSSGKGSAAGASGSSSSGWREHLEPFIAALLFGLHPVHTEAVAGIVGHAEVLCAALSIPALLLYMAAADGRAGGGATHWRVVGAAVLLGWAAALAKEIGITIMGAMLCYDILVAPLARLERFPPAHQTSQPLQAPVQPPPQQQPQQQQQQQQPFLPRLPPREQQPALRSVAGGARASGKAGAPAAAAVAAAATQLLQEAAAAGSSKGIHGAIRGAISGPSKGGEAAACRRALGLKMLRMGVAALAVVLYVKTRSWLAGDQLVRIYRKVENPIPFSTSSLERKLTTGYLHARYAWLLLLPLQLSADWSYACIEYVSSLSDPRNLATAALYLTLLWLGLAARPWGVLLEWMGHRPAADAPSEAQHARRWRLAVAAGLLVGPFFPASNVLFYVGTFIGERLLYFPSVGYCLLLAQPLAAALQPLIAGQEGSRASASSACGASSAAHKPSRLRKAGALAAAALLAGILVFYAGRTVMRNEDWRDEERLFMAAQKVCWRSGKVQLNSGIVERRYQRWEKAEMHFRLAREVDPQGFCEPDYHIGITLLNKNLTASLEYLELGIACKYTAADSVKALNRIFMSLLERSPAHAASVMERWAAVLSRPELQRYTEAATYFENAAAKAGSPLHAIMVLNRAHTALSEARPVRVGRTPSHPVRVAASRRQLDVLKRCLEGRRPVILAMLGAGGNLAAPEVKKAAYSYLSEYGEDCRGPMPLADIPAPEDRAARTTSYHTALLHTLQEADANDPWLQQEWGLILVAAGRQQEALIHLEVAGHIFASQLGPPGGSQQKRGSKAAGKPSAVAVLNSDGRRPISVGDAAQAALAAYQHAQRAAEAATAALGARIDPTSRQHMLCHLQQAECAVLQQQAALPGQPAAAAADAQRCWARAQARGCTQLPAGGGKAGGGAVGGAQAEAYEDEEEDREEL